MAIHAEPHAFAGQTVKIKADAPNFAGADYRIEDWWDRVAGKSWMICDGNPACLDYAIRSGIARGPMDDQVVYGKIGFLGKLIHVSELDLPAEAPIAQAAE